MQLAMDTDIYNHRRYGRPWIATVDFGDPKGKFTFGAFVGTHGEAGTLVINARPGDIVAEGQKDHRARRPESPRYYVVGSNGELERLENKAAAFKLWGEQTLQAGDRFSDVADEELIDVLTSRGYCCKKGGQD